MDALEISTSTTTKQEQEQAQENVDANWYTVRRAKIAPKQQAGEKDSSHKQ